MKTLLSKTLLITKGENNDYFKSNHLKINGRAHQETGVRSCVFTDTVRKRKERQRNNRTHEHRERKNQEKLFPGEKWVFWDKVKSAGFRVIGNHSYKFLFRLTQRLRKLANRQTLRSHIAFFICLYANMQKRIIKKPLLLKFLNGCKQQLAIFLSVKLSLKIKNTFPVKWTKYFVTCWSTFLLESQAYGWTSWKTSYLVCQIKRPGPDGVVPTLWASCWENYSFYDSLIRLGGKMVVVRLAC